MGLCLRVKKTNDTMDIGYGGYLFLRINILNSIEYGLGDKFKKYCLKERFFPVVFIDKLIKLKLDTFILHSDCDGKLTFKQIEKTLNVLKKIEFNNEIWKPEFDSLKDLFQIAVNNKSSITYC